MFDKLFINNCRGKLNLTLVDATSITPISQLGTHNTDITKNLPLLLPKQHPQFILNGPCEWFESWSDSSVQELEDHIDFYLYEVLTVWCNGTRWDSPSGEIVSDCSINEFDMIASWCEKHDKTFTIYTNEYAMKKSLTNTVYSSWPIVCRDSFCLSYGYPGHINTRQGADSYTIYQNVDYKWNCFTYRWDQHRMLAVSLLAEQEHNCLTHYHQSAGRPTKWPYRHSSRYERIVNARNNLQILLQELPLSIEKSIPVVEQYNYSPVPVTDVELNTQSLEPYYLHSFGSLVCETNYEYPWGQISEKTINAARYETPFLLLAGPGSLELLHHWGLKTFDQWWDESYDKEVDPCKRFDAVMDIALEFNKKSFEELTEIKKEMAPILLHNRNLFRTGEINSNIIKRID